MKTPKLSLGVRVPLTFGTLGAILWWESRRPLPRRISRNVAIAAVSAAAMQVAGRPVVSADGARGTTPMRHPQIDLELDTSTALRFHCGELTVSVVWQAGQMVLLGVSPLAMSVWQTALFLSILFHHSNMRLPLWLEHWLVRFIVTPRMHGIHHSIVREETNANWSSGLTLWDWLHRTLRLNVPQDGIAIGVPAYRTPTEVTLTNMLALPFRRQRPTSQESFFLAITCTPRLALGYAGWRRGFRTMPELFVGAAADPLRSVLYRECGHRGRYGRAHHGGRRGCVRGPCGAHREAHGGRGLFELRLRAE
jgi:hypothetical protein